MAKMYPSTMTRRDDPGFDAEKRVFCSLRDSLCDNFHVVWSYQCEDRYKKREADFVITRENSSYFLILEVKSGNIGFMKNQWYQNGHCLSSPVTQARDVGGIIQRRVGKPGPNAAYWDIGLVFPDANLDFPRPDIDGAGLVIDNSKFDRIHEIIENKFASERDNLGGERTILEVIRPDIAFTFTLKGTFDQEREIWTRLTEAQLAVLDILRGKAFRHMIINGVAGSGKTTLAMEAARRCATEGRHSLYLCYNRALAVDVHRQLKKVENMSAFSLGVLESYMEKNGVMMWDAVFVDEAQDFSKDEFWKVRSLQKPDSDAPFWFFQDSQQTQLDSETVADTALAQGWQETDYLVSNIRNTKEIGKRLSGLVEGELTYPEGAPQGAEPQDFTTCTSNELICRIANCVNFWISADVPENRIVVLHVDSGQNCMSGVIEAIKHSLCCSPNRLLADLARSAQGKDRRYPVADYLTPVYCSALRYKGLEADAAVVVVPMDVDLFDDDMARKMRRKMYIGMSRARHRLAVVRAPVDYAYVCKLFWERYEPCGAEGGLQDPEIETQAWRENGFVVDDDVTVFVSLGVSASGVHLFFRGPIDGSQDERVADLFLKVGHGLETLLDVGIGDGPRFFCDSKKFDMQYGEKQKEAAKWLYQRHDDYTNALGAVLDGRLDEVIKSAPLDEKRQRVRKTFASLRWGNQEEVTGRRRKLVSERVPESIVDQELEELLLGDRRGVEVRSAKCNDTMKKIRQRKKEEQQKMETLFREVYEELTEGDEGEVSNLGEEVAAKVRQKLGVGSLEPFWMRYLINYVARLSPRTGP